MVIYNLGEVSHSGIETPPSENNTYIYWTIGVICLLTLAGISYWYFYYPGNNPGGEGSEGGGAGNLGNIISEGSTLPRVRSDDTIKGSLLTGENIPYGKINPAWSTISAQATSNKGVQTLPGEITVITPDGEILIPQLDSSSSMVITSNEGGRLTVISPTNINTQGSLAQSFWFNFTKSLSWKSI